MEPASFSVPAIPASRESFHEIGVVHTATGVPVGGAVPAVGESSVLTQDDLDIPLSKLVALSERPHVGEGDPPAEEGKPLLDQLL